MSAQTNEFKMAFILEMKNAIAELQKAYALFVQFKEPVEAKVDMKISADEAVKKIVALGEELGQCKRDLEELTKATNDRMKQIGDNVKEVNKIVDGLGDAFVASGEEAQAKLKQLNDQVEKLPKSTRDVLRTLLTEINMVKGEIADTGKQAEKIHSRAARGVGKMEKLSTIAGGGGPGAPAPPRAAPAAVAAAVAAATAAEGAPNSNEIIRQIDAALATHQFKLLIDQQFLREQVQAALSGVAVQINGKGGKAVPMDAATAAAVAAGAKSVYEEPTGSVTGNRVRGTRNRLFPDEATALRYVNDKRQQYSGDFAAMAAAVNKAELSGLKPEEVERRFKAGIAAYNRFRQAVVAEIAVLKEAGDKIGASELNQLYGFASKNYLTPFTDIAQKTTLEGLRRGADVMSGKFDPEKISQEEGMRYASVFGQAQRQDGRLNAKQHADMASYWRARMSFEKDAARREEMQQRQYWHARMAFEKATTKKEEAQSAGYWNARIRDEARLTNEGQREQAAYWMARMSHENRITKNEETQQANYWNARRRAQEKENRENAQFWLASKRQPAAQKGIGGLVNTGLAMFGGIGLAYTGYNTLRNSVREYEVFAHQIKEIQATIGSKNPFDAANLSAGIGKTALKYGIDLSVAAEAAKEFAHAGLNVRDVVRELDSTFAAARGIGLTVQQVQDLQLAIKAVVSENDRYAASINHTTAVLDKISVVESRFAVSAQDLAAGLKILSPLVEEFSNGLAGMNDGFDYTNAIITVMVEKLRITGTQAANVTKIFLSRLSRPEIAGQLTEKFGARLKNEDTGDLLPIDQIINELGNVYRSLDGDGIKQKQFADIISGGRNIHAITTLLQEYSRIQEIATVSSGAFGDAQARVGIVSESLLTKVGKLKTSFALYTAQAIEATGASHGLGLIVGGLTTVFGSLAGQGNAVIQVLSILAGAYLFKRIQATYTALSLMPRALAMFSGGASLLTRALGPAVAALGPAGLMIGGALTLLTVVGYVKKRMEDINVEANRYKITLRDASKITESPQFTAFKDDAMSVGLLKQDESILGYNRAYKTVRSAIGGEGNPAYKAIESEIKSLGQMTDIAFRKEFEQNPKRFKKFQTDFAKIFITQLPKDVQDQFKGMANDSERVAKAMELIGGAAFTATYQMKAAIEDLHAATNRMLDDTVAKLAQIEEQKKNPSLMRRIFGGANLFEKTSLTSQGYSVERNAGIYEPSQLVSTLTKQAEGIPVYQAILGNPRLRQQLLNTIDPKIMQGKEFVGGDLLDTALRVIHAQPQMKDLLETQLLLRTGGPAAARQLSLLSNEDLRARDVSEDEIRRIRAGEMAGTVIKGVQDRGTAQIRQADPMALYLEMVNKLVQRNGSPVTQGLLDDVTKTGNALDGFSDLLLKTAREIYDAFHRFVEDREFARTFGQEYDEGGALVQLGRNFRRKHSDTATTFQWEMTELERKIDFLTTHPTKRGHAAEGAAANLTAQITKLETQLKDFNSGTFADIFGNDKHGLEVKKKFLDVLREARAGNYDNLRAFLTEWPDIAIKAGLKMQQQSAQRVQNAEQEAAYVERYNQLRQAELPVTATMAQKLSARAQSAADTYKAQVNTLKVRKAEEKMSNETYALELNRLAVDYERNAVLDARLATVEAQNELEQQQYANMQNMLSGFRKLATDGSIWEEVVSPNGSTAAERWKQSAQAMRKILLETITPVFKTISDRFMENAFKGLSDTLYSRFASVRNFAGMGESELKANVTATRVGEIIATQFVSAGKIVAADLSMALTPKAIDGPIFGGSDKLQAMLGITPEMKEAAAQKRAKDMQDAAALARKKVMYGAIGLGLGQIGGTMVGKGGAGAQMGSQIGSVLGLSSSGLFAAGTFLGGPIGGAVLATAGGLLGGLLGGRGDKHEREQDQPVIRQLDAIERAQRETITAIESQTDALLKPENRFFGLPSNFNTPAYASAFGGGGGIGGDVNITVQVSGSNASPAEIARAVEDAMGNALNKQRSSQSWGR